MSFGGTKDRLVFLREIGLDELGMGDEFGKRGHIPNSSKVFILGVGWIGFRGFVNRSRVKMCNNGVREVTDR